LLLFLTKAWCLFNFIFPVFPAPCYLPMAAGNGFVLVKPAPLLNICALPGCSWMVCRFAFY
jgi:hypothetical protein